MRCIVAFWLPSRLLQRQQPRRKLNSIKAQTLGGTMHPRVVLIAALIASSCTALTVAPVSSGDLADLEQFITVPVEQRFAQARASGDSRFLGVYDYSLSVPGLASDYGSTATNSTVLPIPGTSDAHRSARESELNAEARRYAEKYNELLLQQK